ncbi:MAG TPA: ABC transporter permease [Steroidobacteraceae bacterium]|nr:ABC transporter permease [Steroidobacteraceae bacterium]
MTQAANSSAFAGVHNATIEQVEAAIQQRRRERARRDQIGALIYPIGMMVVLIAVWQAAALLFSFPPYLLPAPSAIAQAMDVNAAVLIKQSLATTVEILLGFALSVAVGVPLALAIYLWRPFERAVYPLLISSQAVPKVAVAPLFLVWFGFGLVPKVLIAFLIAFFPVVINTVMGLAALEREKIYLAQSMGLGPVATFLKIQLPNALPSIFAGLKISITLAVVGAVVGEFVGGQGGLGYLLLIANGNMDTALLFAGIVALTVLGVVLFGLIGLAERLVLPPHAVERASFARESM